MTASVPTRPVPINTTRVRSNAPTAPAAPTRAHATLRVAAYTAPTAVSAYDGPTEQIGPSHPPVSATVMAPAVDAPVEPHPATASGIIRTAFVFVLALLPILGTAMDAFELVPMSATSLVVLTLALVAAVLIAIAPHPTDAIVGRGLVAGVVAFLVSDGARLLAVNVLDSANASVVGITTSDWGWRYVAEGGGLGVAFFVVAYTVGADRWKAGHAMLAGTAFVAAPAWTLLMGTAALAPRGEELLFPLNPATVVLTLVGHLVFGLLLGLAFRRTRRTS